MRKLIKKYTPKPIFNVARDFITWTAIKYYRLRHGPLIVREGTTDKHVFRQIFVQRDYNLPINIEPKFIIDAGAYVGYSSIYFSRKYPEAKVIAIEPEYSNYIALSLNILRTNIHKTLAALTSKSCFVDVIDNDNGNWGFSVEEGKTKDSGKVPGYTIDEIMDMHNIDTIDILKIDIEGGEEELFYDNYDWLGKVKVLVIELHDWLKPGSSDNFHKAMANYSWDKIERGENLIFINKDYIEDETEEV